MLRRSLVALSVFLIAPACTTLSSGHRYTLAKVAADQTLVPGHRELPPQLAGGADQVIQVHEYLTLTLKCGYLRYLDSIQRPEVLVFVRVLARPRDANQETLVWEKVYLNNEDVDQHLVVNKDSFLPKIDIPLLPSVQYAGDDLTVQIRIIEMDQADNERFRGLVNAASSTVAAFRPESAVGLSVFQTVVSFLSQQNSDDIEFECDIGIRPEATTVERMATDGVACANGGAKRREDMILKPRIGTYVLVKTEHPNRTNYPSNYFDLGHHAIRYGVAKVLEFGTLGFFNWSLWEDLGANEHNDVYSALLGRPFAIDRGSWMEPLFVGDRLQVAGYAYYPSRSAAFDGGELVFDGDILVVRHGRDVRPFRDQSYLVFSIDRTSSGADLTKLRANAKAESEISKLLQTGQPTPAELGKVLEEARTGILREVFGKGVMQKAQQALDSAKTADGIGGAQADASAQIDLLQADGRLTAAAAEALKKDLALRVKQARERLAATSPLQAEPSVLALLAGDVTKEKVLVLTHPAGRTLTHLAAFANDTALRDPVWQPRATAPDIEGDCRLDFAEGLPTQPTRITVRALLGGEPVRATSWVLPSLPITKVLTETAGGEWVPSTGPLAAGAKARLVTTAKFRAKDFGDLVTSLVIDGGPPLAPRVIDDTTIELTNPNLVVLDLLSLLQQGKVVSAPARLHFLVAQ